MTPHFDIRHETPITLSDVARYLPKRGGRKIHYSTVFRWATKGARGRILQSILVGGIRYTSLEALGRFLETSTVAPPYPVGMEEMSRVNQALDEAGL